MKKSIIAGAGVAALGFAALPFAGVFAATSGQFTDTLDVTVQGGCTIETSGTQGDGTYVDRTFSKTIAAGTVDYLNDNGSGTLSGDTLTVSCNGADATKAWTVTITPPENGTLKGTTDNTKTIAPGAATSGATSGWAIKSNANGSGLTDSYANYTAAPTSASDFVKGSLAQGASGTFNPSYRIFVATGQAPETYHGVVTYSVSVGSV